MATIITSEDVKRIAKLANIPVTDNEIKKLAGEFTKTLVVVEQLNTVDITDVEPVHTTGLKNVFREDIVDETRMFTQEQALANAPLVSEGYFVVDQVIAQDE